MLHTQQTNAPKTHTHTHTRNSFYTLHYFVRMASHLTVIKLPSLSLFLLLFFPRGGNDKSSLLMMMMVIPLPFIENKSSVFFLIKVQSFSSSFLNFLEFVKLLWNDYLSGKKKRKKKKKKKNIFFYTFVFYTKCVLFKHNWIK